MIHGCGQKSNLGKSEGFYLSFRQDQLDQERYKVFQIIGTGVDTIHLENCVESIDRRGKGLMI